MKLAINNIKLNISWYIRIAKKLSIFINTISQNIINCEFERKFHYLDKIMS